MWNNLPYRPAPWPCDRPASVLPLPNIWMGHLVKEKRRGSLSWQCGTDWCQPNNLFFISRYFDRQLRIKIHSFKQRIRNDSILNHFTRLSRDSNLDLRDLRWIEQIEGDEGLPIRTGADAGRPDLKKKYLPFSWYFREYKSYLNWTRLRWRDRTQATSSNSQTFGRRTWWECSVSKLWLK